MRIPFFAHAFMVSFITLCPALGGIIIDYSHDSFFGSNAAAKAALEAAVADVNAVIDFDLDAITNDVTAGVGSGASPYSATVDFNYKYTNPATGSVQTIADSTLAADEFRLFVGMQNLMGATLGEGGPGAGAEASIGYTFGSTGTLQDAFDAAAANDEHRRGGGPLIATLGGTVEAGTSNEADLSFGLGLSLGNMWFDQDRNNDGAADSAVELASSWHFDHTSTVASGKTDFYSVALHETLHALGYGASQTWDEMASGSQWSGSNVAALVGSGASIINGGHVSSGFISNRLSDGGTQTSILTSSIGTGVRKSLTHLDVAFIQDIGFNTVVAVPEPSSFLLFGFVLFGICGRRRGVPC